LGLDFSEYAIKQCRALFSEDPNKSFMLYIPSRFFNTNFIIADLVVSLDVLYHIVDDRDYYKTLHDIFSSSRKFVILYTSIEAYRYEKFREGSHVRHRDTLSDLQGFMDFKIEGILQQEYPNLSSADFIILKKFS